MRIFVGLDNGLLPDRFGKHAPEAYQLDGHPVRRARTAIGRLWQAAIPTRGSSIVTRARTRLTRRTTTR